MKKGQISLKKLDKTTKFKFKISLNALNFVQNMSKNTLFLSTLKKGQTAKPFYFWQIASKKAKWQP
jgi:hypothetical protein